MPVTVSKSKPAILQDVKSSSESIAARKMKDEQDMRSRQWLNMLRLVAGGAMLGVLIVELGFPVLGIGASETVNLSAAIAGGALAFVLAKRDYIA